MKYQAASEDEGIDGIVSQGIGRRDFLRAGARGAGYSLLGAGIASVVGCEGKWDPSKGYKGTTSVYITVDATIVDDDIGKKKVPSPTWGDYAPQIVDKYLVKFHVPSESIKFTAAGLEDFSLPDITRWREVSHKDYLDFRENDRAQIDIFISNCDRYEPEGEPVRYEITRRSQWTAKNLRPKPKGKGNTR